MDKKADLRKECQRGRGGDGPETEILERAPLRLGIARRVGWRSKIIGAGEPIRRTTDPTSDRHKH
jgi:hypothetical protein